MNDEHDWSTPTIPWQGAIDVYRTNYGQVAIRQEAAVPGDDDDCVVIAPSNVHAVIEALLAVVAEDRDDG